VSKVPLLGDLPFIGKLFQHKTEYIDNSDLIIEITPRIITADQYRPDPNVEVLKNIGEPKLDERMTRRLIQYESINNNNNEENEGK
jgi:type II secretory pathway component GspD/PulD (secretin)